MAVEGTIRTGAAAVRWRRDGSGPAVVFLHGFPLSGETWDGVVARLRDRFTCWTLDVIGLGGSESEADEDYGSPGQARAFARVLSELGVNA
jgi:pimeloyl-ACP methyl ester carboxylesterase